MNEYSFLSNIDSSNELLKTLKNPIYDDFKDMFLDIKKQLKDKYYTIDYLPGIMESEYMYSRFFNYTAKNYTNALGKTFNYKKYKDIYLKIIIMLISYNQNTYFETHSFDNKYLTKKHFKGKNERYLFKLESKNIDFFLKLVELSLQDLGDLIVYLEDFKIIVLVNNLRFYCLIFDNLKFIKNIVTTEGLYLYS